MFKMKRNFTKCLLTGVMFMASVVGAKAEVDPNFHIYICFGQSNMEGNAQWEAQDVGNVDERFQMLATCDFNNTNPKRKLGNWYTAECPIVSPDGKLGPTDYFGRTMVASLPNHKIGVVAVAMGGSPIEMFDKDLYEQKMKDNPSEWWVTLAKRHYGGNPYGRIIEMAKKAQEVGVIKGILLHQGCSNNGDAKWPGMVKKIYKDMLRDLGLRASDVPIFVGETEYAEMGGGCSWHNTVVAKIPEVIPTGHVVSAKDIPGNGTDPWHFSAAGYRIFGKRYAEAVLDVMNNPDKYVKHWTIDERLTGKVSGLTGQAFAIVNEAEQKAFYCEYDQLLGYGDFDHAFNVSNEAYQFKIAKTSGGVRLKLVMPDGEEYLMGDATGCLNTQVVTGDCCFVSSNMNGQNGQDLSKGAVWDVQYVEGKGYSIKNVGTGKYLKTNDAAKYDEPTYFTFCTLKEGTATGIEEVRSQREEVRSKRAEGRSAAVYDLQGRKVAISHQPSSISPQPSAFSPQPSSISHTKKGIYIVNGRMVVIR